MSDEESKDDIDDKLAEAVSGVFWVGIVVGVLSYLVLQLIVLAILKVIGQ